MRLCLNTLNAEICGRSDGRRPFLVPDLRNWPVTMLR